MWKDFFSFTKRERLTITLLTVLIVVVQMLIWTSDRWTQFLPVFLKQRYQEEQLFRAYVDSMDNQRRSSKEISPVVEQQKQHQVIKLVAFDPNTADSATLLGLGIEAKVVRNIIKYRSKGGTFRKTSDFGRIYGIKPNVLAALEPYIRIPMFQPETDHRPLEPKNTSKPDEPAPNEVATAPFGQSGLTSGSNFELNSTDTSMLLQIKGVGLITANQIERYRKQLGGFYSLDQLNDIKGLYPETLTRLKSMLHVDPSKIAKLDINKTSLEKLKAHPYLDFWQSKVILELRKARGRIEKLEDLAAYKEFKTTDLERLKWYLSF